MMENLPTQGRSAPDTSALKTEKQAACSALDGAWRRRENGRRRPCGAGGETGSGAGSGARGGAFGVLALEGEAQFLAALGFLEAAMFVRRRRLQRCDGDRLAVFPDGDHREEAA